MLLQTDVSVDTGILVVDKAVGPTSHDVVAMARRALQTRRIGHCGTLDPLASGVLVLCVGPLTRLSEWISRGGKEYEAVIRLGATSSTDDAQGDITACADAQTLPSKSEIAAAMPAFCGVIEQVPPAHSAVKVNGERSYKRARRNEQVELAARRVRVERFEVIEYAPPSLTVRVVCGKGTYIRSLARDLGQVLGCGAYIESLRRTRIGVMRAQDGVAMEVLRGNEDREAIQAAFVEPQVALQGILEAVDLEAGLAWSFLHGQRVTFDAGDSEMAAGPDQEADGETVEEADAVAEYAVYHDGQLLGVGHVEAGQLRPARVFAAATVV